MDKILIFLIFISFSLGQLGRIPFIGNEANIYLYEIPLIIFLIHLFIKHRFTPLNSFFKKFNWIIFFLIYLFITFFFRINSFNFSDNLISFLYFIRLAFYFIFFEYLLFDLKRNKKNISVISRGLIISFILIITFSFLQYFFYPDLRNLLYLGWDPHLYRVFGTFLEPVILAAVLGQFFFLLLFSQQLITNRNLRLLLMILSFVLILLTFSRIIYIAFILTLAIYLLRKNKRYILYLSVFFILALFFLPKPAGEGVNLVRTSTIESRLNDYSQAFKIWEKDPIFGIGYNRIKYYKNQNKENHAAASFHSSFMIMLVTGGILGLGLFLGVLGRLGRLGEFGFYSVIFLGIASLADNVLLHPFVLFVYVTSLVYWITHPSGKSP